MSLPELIAGVEDHEKVLTLFNATSADVEAVSERFADRNIVVEAGESSTDVAYAVLHDEAEFITSLSLAALTTGIDNATGVADAPHRTVLDQLDETMFTSYDPDRMLAASQEIEDRAWRLGRGELHAGFQTTRILRSQLDAYERLGGREGLTVHAYAAPEGPAPESDAFTIHVEDSEEIRTTWFVAYDGGGVDENKCALVAEERGEREYYGFWTYDPSTVNYVCSHLRETYVPTTADGDTAP